MGAACCFWGCFWGWGCWRCYWGRRYYVRKGGGDGGLAGRVASGGIEVCLSSQREMAWWLRLL